MYTNLPVNEMLSMHLDELAEIKPLLQAANQGPNIEVKYDAEENGWVARFTNSPESNAPTPNGATTPPPLVISLDSYHSQFYRFVLENACFQYGGVLFRQLNGIPMGISCAVELAQNTCARYELIFLRAAISGRHWELLEAFKWTGRYIDDIFSIDAFWLDKCHSRAHLYHPTNGGTPIAGIYPPCLTVNPESALFHKPNPNNPNAPLCPSTDGVTFLDFTLFWDAIRHVLMYSTHDKRCLPKYDFSRLLRFPLNTTCLWETCFYGIIKSELNRFVTTCSSLDLFIIPAANLIYELYCKGFDIDKLYSSMRSFLKAKSPLYHPLPHSMKPPLNLSAPHLVWITTAAIQHRVSSLWNSGMPTFDLRNRRLNLPEPTTRPLVPPTPHYPTTFPQEQQTLYWKDAAPQEVKN